MSGEVNLCFIYFHGKDKAKVCPWVYEVFSNAIIIPSPSSMPIIHAKSCMHRTAGSVPTILRKQKFSVLPACEGFWGAAGCYMTTLLGHCRAEASVLQGQWPHEAPSRSQGLQGQQLSAGLPPLPTRTCTAQEQLILFPSRSKSARLWQELGLPCFL